jgi:hypothetical protein
VVALRAVDTSRIALAGVENGLHHRPSFRRLVKWRTGSEVRISYLKRYY